MPESSALKLDRSPDALEIAGYDIVSDATQARIGRRIRTFVQGLKDMITRLQDAIHRAFKQQCQELQDFDFGRRLQIAEADALCAAHVFARAYHARVPRAVATQ